MGTNITPTATGLICRIYGLPELKACPIEATFKMIGKRWTALVLRDMFRGEKRFNRFRENIKGVTSKMLTLRLRELEKSNLVRRKIVSKYPIRVEYELTETGRELGPILLQAASFSMRNQPKTVFKDGVARDPRTIFQKA